MASPIPGIFPDEAIAAGAYIVRADQSDFPNQINSVLAFPEILEEHWMRGQKNHCREANCRSERNC